MKVLHLPENIASQMSDFVEAQRSLGIEARGLVFKNKKIQNNRFVEVLDDRRDTSRLLPRFLKQRLLFKRMQEAVQWADVIHWHFECRSKNKKKILKFIAGQNKACFVEFWGSDIRRPKIAVQDNPYLKELVEDQSAPAGFLEERSLENQRLFFKARFDCIIPGPELQAYLYKEFFPTYHRSEACLLLSEYTPSYPETDRKRPLIVHMPSDQAIKGTSIVLDAIKALQKEMDFDFRLIHGVPFEEAQEILRGCDIMLDQFILGSFGRAAMEAMAYGKPTVCYLKPTVERGMPADHPIVNANRDNLVEVLGRLIENGGLRRELGTRSRRYVERLHDSRKVAEDLIRLYENKLRKRAG